MKQDDLRKLLHNLHITVPLAPATLDQLAAAFSPKAFVAGEMLFREGTENHSLYLIAQGSVALDMHVLGRGDVRILSLGPGDVVAWSALLGDGRMTATATALSDTEVIAAPAQTLRNLCEADHTLAYHLMRGMATAISKRLTATRLQFLDLFRDSDVADLV